MSLVVQGSARRSAKVVAPSVHDIVNLFAERNASRRNLNAQRGRIVELAQRLVRDVTALLEESAPAAFDVVGPEAGEGLDTPLPAGEGARRLAAYATPVAARDWAGEVAGPSEVERRLHISRSTLHDWQKQGAVIGLLAGRRKHVFPLAQFIDGRPVEGLADVAAAAGAPRTAWLWLVEPHPSLGGRNHSTG